MNGTYRVLYAVSDSVYGSFGGPRCILESDMTLANGPGHHGYAKAPDSDTYHIFYHRRILGDEKPGHRFLCKDIMEFDEEGYIKPLKMT